MTATDPVPRGEQRMAALRHANEIRTARSHLKRDLTRAQAVAILEEPPDYVQGMRVIELLKAIPTWGVTKATRCVNASRLPHQKTIGALTLRQRGELVQAVRA